MIFIRDILHNLYKILDIEDYSNTIQENFIGTGKTEGGYLNTSIIYDSVKVGQPNIKINGKWIEISKSAYIRLLELTIPIY